jgi:hypothetical protein
MTYGHENEFFNQATAQKAPQTILVAGIYRYYEIIRRIVGKEWTNNPSPPQLNCDHIILIKFFISLPIFHIGQTSSNKANRKQGEQLVVNFEIPNFLLN